MKSKVSLGDLRFWVIGVEIGMCNDDSGKGVMMKIGK